MKTATRFIIGIVVGVLVGAMVASAGAQGTPGGWEYKTATDELSGKNYTMAATQSLNTVEFSFPYQGKQRATLAVARHPRTGLRILFAIQRGQFSCGLEGCDVHIRFDKGSVRSWPVSPLDMPTDVVAIDNPSGFLSRIRKAKELRIAADFYQEGNRTFIFKVAGLRLK